MDIPTIASHLRRCMASGSFTQMERDLDSWWGEIERDRDARWRKAVEDWFVREGHEYPVLGSPDAVDVAITEAHRLGLDAARDRVRDLSSREPADPPTYKAMQAEVEAYNRDQRLRREAYRECMLRYVTGSPYQCTERAAREYPLRKLQRRVVPDPHGHGQWSTSDSNGRLYWYNTNGDSGAVVAGVPEGGLSGSFLPHLTTERVRTLAALLDNPWEIVDDVTPEGE
jgi:hypothetical protein